MQDAVRCDDYTPTLAVVSALCTPSSLSTRQKASSNRQPNLIPRASPPWSHSAPAGEGTLNCHGQGQLTASAFPWPVILYSPPGLCASAFPQIQRLWGPPRSDHGISDPRKAPYSTLRVRVTLTEHRGPFFGSKAPGIFQEDTRSGQLCLPPQSDPETRGSALCCICTTLPPASSLPFPPPRPPPMKSHATHSSDSAFSGPQTPWRDTIPPPRKTHLCPQFTHTIGEVKPLGKRRGTHEWALGGPGTFS